MNESLSITKMSEDEQKKFSLALTLLKEIMLAHNTSRIITFCDEPKSERLWSVQILRGEKTRKYKE